MFITKPVNHHYNHAWINPSQNIKRVLSINKVIRVIIVIIAIILCSWQLASIFLRYFDYPTTISIQTTKRQTFKIPPLMICPTWLSYESLGLCRNSIKGFNQFGPYCSRFLTEFTEAIVSACSATQWCEGQDLRDIPFQKLNVSLEDSWLNYSVKVNLTDPTKTCQYSLNATQCEIEVQSGTWLTQNYALRPTYFSGKCLTISQAQELHYTKYSMGLELTLFDFINNYFVITIEKETQPYHVLLESGIILMITRGYKLTNVKKFFNLNTKHEPCISDEEAINCKESCIEEGMEALDLCRLPMLDPMHHPRTCKTLWEVQSSHEKYQEWIVFKEMSCNCPRKCTQLSVDIKLQWDSADYQIPKNITFEILFDEIIETVIENYAYNLSSLLTDLVGNVGFYFGLSLISILETFTTFLKKHFSKKKIFGCTFF